MLAGASLFVLGFSIVFVGLGILSAGVSRWFLVNQRALTVVLGVLVIALGLVFAGALPISQRDIRVHRVPAVGVAAAPVLGSLFAIGWQPCIGPTLATILGLSSYLDPVRGGLLMGFYSLGLGVPFIVSAVAWRRASGAIGWLRRRQLWLTRAGGAMLVVVGTLLLAGWWDQAVQWLQVQLADVYQPSL